MDVQSLPDFDVVMSLWYGGAAVSWEVVLKLNRGKCMSNMLGFGQLTAGGNNKTTTSIGPENIPTHFPTDLPCLPCSVFVEFVCSERLVVGWVGGGTVKDPRTPKNRLGVGSFRWPWRGSERREEKRTRGSKISKFFHHLKNTYSGVREMKKQLN